MEQTPFCYDGPLIHAFLEIMMNPYSDTRDKNSSILLFCLLHLAAFHGTSPAPVGKKRKMHSLRQTACPSLLYWLHLSWHLGILLFRM